MKYLIIIIILFSCTGNKARQKVFTLNDCPLHFFKVGGDLKYAKENFNKKFVEIEGYFHFSYHSLYLTKARHKSGEKIGLLFVPLFIKENNSIRKLIINDYIEFDKKRVIIRGTLDSADNGPMEEHYFTVNEICYLKIIN